MISLLEQIVEFFGSIPDYILAGAVEVLNGFFTVVEVALIAFLSLLPTMPSIVPPPSSVAMANSILPVGAVVSVATPLLVVFGVWLGGSWILRKSGVIE